MGLVNRLKELKYTTKRVGRAMQVGIHGIGFDHIKGIRSNFIDQVKTLHVFPNPASDLINLNVSGSEATTARLRIVNATGRMLRTRVKQHLTQGQQRITMPVSDLQVGTYLLPVEMTAGYSATDRFTESR